MRRFFALIGFLAVSFAAGGIGSVPTVRELPTWYAGLKKPPWNPPNQVFGPIWTSLYIAMAVAAWLAYQDREKRTRNLSLFGTQLVLNAAWPWLFFGRRSPRDGAVSIGLLWMAVGATTISFWSSRREAGLLFLPYWVWVSYAAGLNLAILRLNP